MKKKLTTKTLRNLLLSTVLLANSSVAIAKTTEENACNKTNFQKPYQGEITQKEVKEMVGYFAEAEMSDDEDLKDGFPWRSFRSLINSLQTQEQCRWLIETIPNWPDGQDQESLSIMATKIGELAGPAEIDMLLNWVNSPIDEKNKGWALECLSRIKDPSNSAALKTIIENSNSWLDAEKLLGESPPKAASISLCKSKDRENLKFIIATLESNPKNGSPDQILKNKAAKEGLYSLLR